MSNLAEPDNVSETNSNDSIPIVIDDDRQKDYESEEDYESEDDENENDDERENNDNEIDDENDNEDEDEEDDNDNEEATSKQKPTSSNVWDFVDKTTRKCSNCSKTFGKKTGTSSIRVHLKSHGLRKADNFR